jgi:hypothetical protein
MASPAIIVTNTNVFIRGVKPFTAGSPILTEEILINNQKELEWFVGFSEAESLFYINPIGRLIFAISLHSDDLGALLYIQSLLSRIAKREIGRIEKKNTRNACSFTISKFIDIYEIILPIFNKNFMTTSKHLYFLDFQRAAEIKAKVLTEEDRKLNKEELYEILNLKSKMNIQRTSFDVNLLPKRELTSERLLGFVEGEGTFTASQNGLKPFFSINTHSKNEHFLHEIAKFFRNLPYNPSIGPRKDMVDSQPKASITSLRDSATKLRLENTFQIFNYILPFFKSVEFKSRKAVDFNY